MYRAELTPESTPQEAFNHIKAACEAGSFPSVTGGSVKKCLYRLDKTPECEKACVAGIFIKNKDYSEIFDSQMKAAEAGISINADGVLKHIGGYPEFLFTIKTNTCLINELQMIHDDMSRREWNNEKFLEEVKKIFKKYEHDITL